PPFSAGTSSTTRCRSRRRSTSRNMTTGSRSSRWRSGISTTCPARSTTTSSTPRPSWGTRRRTRARRRARVSGWRPPGATARWEQPTDEPEVERLDLQHGAGAATSKSLAVQVDGLYKSFEVPLLATQTVATRIRHPRLRHGYRTLRVLKDISFEIGQGEFFG